MEEMVFIDSITVGDRARKRLGDIASLAKSIEDLGLLHPVVITSNRELVAGQRRLEAVRSLGSEKITATVLPMTPEKMLRAEYDENAERVDLRPSEMVALGRLIEEKVKEQVAEERRERGRRLGRGEEAGDSPVSSAKGHVRDRVGKALGTGGSRYEHAKRVVEAAESEPDKYGDLPHQMDETGNVEGTYRQMRERQKGNGDVPSAKSRASAKYRAKQIKSMSSKGHTAAQIANKIGVSRGRVMELANRHGVELVEHKLGKQQTKINPAEVIENLVTSVESNVEAASLVEPRIGELDTEDVRYWSESLAKSLRRLQKFRRNLERSLNHE